MDEFIAAHRDEILARALCTLASSYPQRSPEEVLDGAVVFLDEVVGALRLDASGAPDAEIFASFGVPSAAEHGSTRHSQGVAIGRVVHDYGALCDKLHEVAEERGTRFELREHQVLNRCVDEAVARAVEAFAAKASFSESERLGFLVHEIRNAACSGSLAFQLLRSGKVPVGGKTAAVIERALGQIEALAGHALDEARLAAGPVGQRERVALTELLGEVVEGAFPERGIHVELAAEPGLEVEADRALLASAVGNLLQNAIKFTRDDEVVRLRACSIDQAVRIEVEDRCGGLPEGAADRMFEPFVRRSNHRRGVGLGLAIARRAIEAHGGTLTVRDLPGVGCVMTVLLPSAARRGD